MANIVLVGASGHIGSALLPYLRAKGRVLAIDKRSSLLVREEILIGDLNDISLARTYITSDVDAVICVAGVEETEALPDPKDYDLLYLGHVKPYLNVLQACSEVGTRRVILASTNHVTGGFEQDGYSMLGRKITTEDPVRPDSIYASLKVAVECIAKLFAQTHDLPVTAIRFGTFAFDETEALAKSDRSTRTILRRHDLYRVIDYAIGSQSPFEIIYAASATKEGPWKLPSVLESAGGS